MAQHSSVRLQLEAFLSITAAGQPGGGVNICVYTLYIYIYIQIFIPVYTYIYIEICMLYLCIHRYIVYTSLDDDVNL